MRIRPANAVTERVLACAGARPQDRDVTDQRIVDQVASGTGSLVDCVGPGDIHYAPGTVVSASTDTVVLTEEASLYDGGYTGRRIAITSGTGAGQVRDIVEYAGDSRTATVDPAWDTVPDATSAYDIVLDCSRNAGGFPPITGSSRPLVLPDDPGGDTDGDGYTNLEEWLHEFAAEVECQPDPQPDGGVDGADAGTSPPPDGDASSSVSGDCGCATGHPAQAAPWLLTLLLSGYLRRHRPAG
jgi:hypothetical protein